MNLEAIICAYVDINIYIYTIGESKRIIPSRIAPVPCFNFPSPKSSEFLSYILGLIKSFPTNTNLSGRVMMLLREGHMIYIISYV